MSLRDVIPTIIAIAALMVLVEISLYYLLYKVLNYKYALPFMLVAPAAIGLALLVVYPIFYNLVIAFSDTNLFAGRFPTRPGSVSYGFKPFFDNIVSVFAKPILQQQTFWPVFARTIAWTFIQVSFHVTVGFMLASLLNRPMKLRGVYRTFILFPWAIPQVIAVLAWRGEFNFEYGYFNIILRNIGLNPINWMTDPAWNFFAINLTNWWLGVPFMSAILLGGLQSIDTSYYEAAEMDGATKFQQLRNITLPLMQPVMTPAIILGVIWTFNQFNIPYFINQQELESSDILVTALFRAAFEYSRYGFAAAFALVIFVILILFTIFYMKVTGFQLQSGQEKKRLAAAKAVGE
ncbi:carbohydrate ABC transporter permease [Salinispira pacifica]|uniref:Maltose/maltodextrin ABC transporter, permease protein MalF n=1 Tax=Salinispira pacifica TaxID=1307761 RepID=V5WJ84_9SPIO|nr:sugar ABC transporter permease [Salinispira pacifica]AHC15843.1 Maltose/maltodextrin ABC transporter, permease protein MalF [Salinispira pacifica]